MRDKLRYTSAAAFPWLVIYIYIFHFGVNGLPLFSVFSNLKNEMNIFGARKPLLHAAGGKYMRFTTTMVFFIGFSKECFVNVPFNVRRLEDYVEAHVIHGGSVQPFRSLGPAL